MLGGLHTTSALVLQPRSWAGIQLALSPLGARSLVGAPAAALPTGQWDARDLLGTPADEACERLAAASRLASPIRGGDRLPRRAHAQEPGPRAGAERGPARVGRPAAARRRRRHHRDLEPGRAEPSPTVDGLRRRAGHQPEAGRTPGSVRGRSVRCRRRGGGPVAPGAAHSTCRGSRSSSATTTTPTWCGSSVTSPGSAPPPGSRKSSETSKPAWSCMRQHRCHEQLRSPPPERLAGLPGSRPTRRHRLPGRPGLRGDRLLHRRRGGRPARPARLARGRGVAGASGAVTSPGTVHRTRPGTAAVYAGDRRPGRRAGAGARRRTERPRSAGRPHRAGLRQPRRGVARRPRATSGRSAPTRASRGAADRVRTDASSGRRCRAVRRSRRPRSRCRGRSRAPWPAA